MPKIRTKRARAHAPAAHLSKHTENNVQQKSNEPPKSAEHIIRDTLGSMNDDASQRPKQQLTKRAKREERRRRLMEKLQQTHASTSKKTVAKKSALEPTNTVLSDLNKLRHEVHEYQMKNNTSASEKTAPKPITTRQREEIAKTEMARFQAVLNHPSFRENPLSAIRAHVQQVFGQENK